MRNIIVGTAGHIDHGKTALVRALTGMETDRLEEEIRRGISIDLGFAWMEAPEGLLLGFVDVPGHERFVRNMLAGAAGIDLVILVIAADESVKPQTREHFDICRLLGVSKGLVALTKADLVDADLLDLARLEIEEFLAGSFLEGAPIIPVSSLTGQGISDLRAALAALARDVPPRDTSQPPRLPVDRSFSMKGFGTVVTGTLISGRIDQEAELELHPGALPVRVRGIQVHGRPAECALAGQRSALNLSGLDAASIHRGMVVAGKGCFQATRVVDCRLHLLPSAPPLKHRAPLHFHSGTAETVAELRLLEGKEAATPGESSLVRLLLREPLLVLPGDRFIVRRFSPVVTVGGGEVLDIDGPRFRAKDRPSTRLAQLETAGPAVRIALLVEEKVEGKSVAEVARRAGLTLSQVVELAPRDRLILAGEPPEWLFSAAEFQGWMNALESAVAQFHQANPLLAGMPRQELRSRLPESCPPFTADEVLRRSTRLVAEGDSVRLRSHEVVLSAEEEALLARMERFFSQTGWEAPPLTQALSQFGGAPQQAWTLLQILLRQGSLVRVNENLILHQQAAERLKAVLAQHRGEHFSVALFKEWTGLSRKYAIPILEYLDREKLTRRSGDERIVL